MFSSRNLFNLLQWKSFLPIRLSSSIQPVVLAEDVFGSPDADRCLVIAHGLFGFRANWRSLAKAFCERTKIQIVTVDMRNHGDSPFTNTMTYEEMAADLIETIKKHQKPKTILMGHSMGGKAAMLVALQQAKLLKKLIVVDIAPTVSAAIGEIPLYTRLLIDNLHQIQSEQNLVTARRTMDKIFQNSMESLKQNKTLRDFLLTLIAYDQSSGRFYWRANLEIIEEFMTEIMHFPEKYQTSSTDLETLFIAGEKSKYIDENSIPVMKRMFPSHRLMHIANAGHWVHSERPKDFLNSVLPELEI